ncbi:MAG: indole-3-glycerol phosphate synthase [Bacteroidetes bacterium GWF2_40_14]|nr:MAG: indole-3-glycerol phosphate synthase [Bacteroidetes bacterium GWF2_40_14]
MNILEQIKQHKLAEVASKKELYPIKLLEQTPYFLSSCVSMKKYISDSSRSGIIAEFKRKSPSKGDINKYANVQEITLGYMQSGASALSVITDEHFFGANKDDLQTARKFNYCPILRKDFIVDEYQLVEAKSMGADVVLLIAKMLLPKEIAQFSQFAKSLGLEVFLEFHDKEEIKQNELAEIDLAGINNRNLNSFEVDIENSISLANLLPKEVLKIAESGIDSSQTIKKLRQNGFSGFLIGEYFMRNSNPAEKCKELIKQLHDEY